VLPLAVTMVAVLAGCGGAAPRASESLVSQTLTTSQTTPQTSSTTTPQTTQRPEPQPTSGVPGGRPVPRPSPGRTVVLDPGHNGGNAAHPEVVNRPVRDGRGRTKPCNTTGTSTDAGYPEHAFTWDVARRVRELLTAQGVHVVLTRADDQGVGPCVDERARLADAANPDVIVSIHADGAASSGRGFHVAYSDPPLNAAQGGPAHDLATRLRDAMRTAGFPPSNYIGSQGLSGRDDLAGLNLAHRPAALVECANMRNPGEAATVTTAEGRDRYATAIAIGILDWLSAH
jgi:N-acetylmuramoyl-L-alanine amidase